MSDPSADADPPSPPLNLSLEGSEDALAPLRARIDRLEHAVNNLQDTSALEERIVERLRDGQIKADANLAHHIQATPPSPTIEQPRSETPPPAAPRQAWFWWDVGHELRLIWRMFRDPRYRVRWFTWAIVLLFLPVILLSNWWFPLAWIPWLGTYLDKIMNVVLAFVVFKALSREAKRYQQFIG